MKGDEGGVLESVAQTFQCHTGPMKSKNAGRDSRSLTVCFNTTPVQLKVDVDHDNQISEVDVLQYHTGPIKRRGARRLLGLLGR